MVTTEEAKDWVPIAALFAVLAIITAYIVVYIVTKAFNLTLGITGPGPFLVMILFFAVMVVALRWAFAGDFLSIKSLAIAASTVILLIVLAHYTPNILPKEFVQSFSIVKTQTMSLLGYG